MAKWRFQDDLADLKTSDKTRWNVSTNCKWPYNPSYKEIVFPSYFTAAFTTPDEAVIDYGKELGGLFNNFSYGFDDSGSRYKCGW
jgi:predicted metalloendopeptidase